jgi:hypothetical protein
MSTRAHVDATLAAAAASRAELLRQLMAPSSTTTATPSSIGITNSGSVSGEMDEWGAGFFARHGNGRPPPTASSTLNGMSGNAASATVNTNDDSDAPNPLLAQLRAVQQMLAEQDETRESLTKYV